VICDFEDQMSRIDINMFVLFFIAVAIVYFAFHTPEL